MKIKRIATIVSLVFISACASGGGEKVGTITKLTQEGVFCRTWEGTIIRGGLSGGSGAFGTPFDFTIARDFAQTDLLSRMQKYMEAGTEVKIFFTSYEGTLCASASGHFVYRVEPVK